MEGQKEPYSIEKAPILQNLPQFHSRDSLYTPILLALFLDLGILPPCDGPFY